MGLSVRVHGPRDKEVVAYLQSVQLHVRISMRQPLDHTRDGVLGAAILSRHLIADIHDVLPVLGGEVLVGRLGCTALESVAVL